MLFNMIRPFVVLLLMLVLNACDSVEERVAGHYERGQTLLEQEQPAKALLEFLNALKLDENHVPSHLAIGQVEEARGNLQAAFGRFTRVVELQPGNLDARLKVIRFMLVGQNFDQASVQMGAALKLDPNRADVQALNASIAIQQGDLAAARQALDLALTLDPKNLDAALAEVGYLVRSDQLPAARARSDQALTLYPENLALHLMKIQILEQLGDQAGIGAQLTTMIQAFPDQSQFHEARARWAMRVGDMEIAEEGFRTLVEAYPDDTARVATLIRFLRQKDGDTVARAELAEFASRDDDGLEYELMLAQFDVETGHRDDAIAYLRTLINRPDTGRNEARIALARLLIANGGTAEAYLLVDEVLAEDPKNIAAMTLNIARKLDEGELEIAIDRVRAALNEAPNDLRLLQLAGRAQELSGNLDLANDRYASAVRLNDYAPDTVVRYVGFLNRVQRSTAVNTVLTEALSRNPRDARLLDMLGFARIRLGNWAGAEQAAQALEPLNPTRARQMRAASLIAQEQFDEGASLLKETVADSASDSRSVVALVQVYLREGQIAEAEKFLDGLLSENPGNIQALGLRGNLYLNAGDYAAAEEKYRAILEIDPQNGGAYSALSRMLTLKGDEAGAEQQLLAGLDSSPDNLLLLARLADLHNRQSNFDEAIALYNRLYEFVPNSLVIANNLASAVSDHRANDPDQLDRAYAIAGRLRTAENPFYLDTFGWTRYLKGEYNVALESIKVASEALPDNPWVKYHLGMVHAALKQPVEARAALQAALDNSDPALFPPTVKIRETLQQLGTQ